LLARGKDIDSELAFTASFIPSTTTVELLRSIASGTAGKHTDEIEERWERGLRPIHRRQPFENLRVLSHVEGLTAPSKIEGGNRRGGLPYGPNKTNLPSPSLLKRGKPENSNASPFVKRLDLSSPKVGTGGGFSEQGAQSTRRSYLLVVPCS